MSPSEPVVLRHPTEKLEVVVPRGRLAELLIHFGYTEVEPEPPDLPNPLSTIERFEDEQEE